MTPLLLLSRRSLTRSNPLQESPRAGKFTLLQAFAKERVPGSYYPEAPLVVGKRCCQAGIACWSQSECAQMEGSRAFRQGRYGASKRSNRCRAHQRLGEAYVRHIGAPVVVKVMQQVRALLYNRLNRLEGVREFRHFGDAGATVVVESS